MKKTFSMVALVFSMVTLAEVPPIYPKRLEAVLLKSITDKTPLHVVVGELRDCEKTVVSDWEFYKCAAEQTYALVSHTGTQPIHLQFNKVFVQYSKWQDTILRRYTFAGEWTDTTQRIPLNSKMAVVVYQFDNKPGDYKGFLELGDYDMREALQASEVPSPK